MGVAMSGKKAALRARDEGSKKISLQARENQENQ